MNRLHGQQDFILKRFLKCIILNANHSSKLLTIEMRVSIAIKRQLWQK